MKTLVTVTTIGLLMVTGCSQQYVKYTPTTPQPQVSSGTYEGTYADNNAYNQQYDIYPVTENSFVDGDYFLYNLTY